MKNRMITDCDSIDEFRNFTEKPKLNKKRTKDKTVKQIVIFLSAPFPFLGN